MERNTLEWFDLLAKGLIWAAGMVLLLSVIGAITIAGSDTALPFLENVERQGRAIASLASLAGGIAAAGVLSGLGAILRLLLDDRLTRGEPVGADPAEPAEPSTETPPAP